MNTKVGIFAGCFLGAAVLPAHGSNFSYTFVEGSLGVMTLEDSINFSGEIYDEFGLTSISGSYQCDDNFALTASSSAFSNEGRYTDITQSQTSFAATFPVAVANGLDIVPYVGFVSAEAEFCDESMDLYFNCFKQDDTGAIYGVTSRFWAAPDKFELNLGIADSAIEGSDATFSLGGGYWFQQHHSARVRYAVNSDSATFSLGYAFTW